MVTVSGPIVPKSWFETWPSPREFFLEADECMGQFEPDEIMGMPQAQRSFDAYVARLFARVDNDHTPCEIRLAVGIFPDAQLRDGQGVYQASIFSFTPPTKFVKTCAKVARPAISF